MSEKEKTSDKACFKLEGQVVNVSSIRDGVEKIIALLTGPSSFAVFTLNMHHLVTLRTNNKFSEAYQQADLVTADGFPVVFLASLVGISIERAAGSDLIVPLCNAAARHCIPIFLFGTTPKALSAAAQNLSRQVDGLEIRGILCPPQGFSEDTKAAEEALRVIELSGARLCFLALSTPVQEIFAAAALRRVKGVGFVGVGAGLDFIARTQIRSPVLLQRLNLEWAWRLGRNPRRLGLRYFRCGVLFAELLVRSLFSGRPRIGL